MQHALALPAASRETGLHLPTRQLDAAREAIAALELEQFVHCEPGLGLLRLRTDSADALGLIGHDTTALSRRLQLDTEACAEDLAREIWLSLLATPRLLDFPSSEELLAAVRMRAHIVRDARRTALAFRTNAAERPEGLWSYADGTGFTVVPGVDLIEALQRATQPGCNGGRLYDFSCYRATEYVILLGIAREAKENHPQLYARLQRQNELRAVMSGSFHEVYLRELGDTDDPLPPAYYVPGDRVWFRNPDARSSDASGFEGSWVIYLGNGQFANFWKRDQPFTMQSKCLEIYHWRHGVYQDAQGEARVDEDRVAAHMEQTLRDPTATARIVDRMMRLRDPKGVYQWGGCVDRSRESPRWVCPGTTDISLPDA